MEILFLISAAFKIIKNNNFLLRLPGFLGTPLNEFLLHRKLCLGVVVGHRLLSLSVAVSLYVGLWLSLSLALSGPGVPEKTQKKTLHNVAAFWRFSGKRYCGGSVGQSNVDPKS